MFWLRSSAFKRQTFNHEAKIRVRYSDQLRSCLWWDEWIRIPVPHVAWKHLASCTVHICIRVAKLKRAPWIYVYNFLAKYHSWDDRTLKGNFCTSQDKLVWVTKLRDCALLCFGRSRILKLPWWSVILNLFPCSLLVRGGLGWDSTLRYVTTTSKLFAVHLAQPFFYSTFITDSTEIGLFRRTVVKLSRWNRKQNKPYKNFNSS